MQTYDELILCNCSCYDPLYPLEQLFEQMEGKTCDYWGLSKHPSAEYAVVPKGWAHRVPDHLQSHFMVFKKKVISHAHFRQWWSTFESTPAHKEASGFREEVLFTKALEATGCTGATYLPENFVEEICPKYNAWTMCPETLLKEYHMPFISRDLLSEPEGTWYMERVGAHAREALRFVQESTSYPVDIIWSDLLHNNKMSDLKNTLHLNYILPSAICDISAKQPMRTALICYVYYEEQIDLMLGYIKNMPSGTDVYIVCKIRYTYVS